MSAKNPTVSVIIPTYNRAGYIKEAVESVLSQKGSWDLDIIVVDDGSTDDTEKILKLFENKIRYFKILHSGLPAVARNFGIAKAKGSLIAFQDSDDQWPPDKLSLEVPFFDDPNVVMAYSQAKAMSSDGKISSKNVVAPNKLKDGESFTSLIKGNVISTLTVMTRKDALKAVGGFNESEKLRAVEDYELWLRLSTKFPNGLKSINKTLAYYRVHGDNISTTSSLLAVERLMKVYDSIWKNNLDKNKRYALEKQISDMQENWSRLKNESEEPPGVSVIMGIYKDEKYVKMAVQSILDQTYNDFEFIIIDDGSKDNSAKIVENFNDSRIRIIHQTNHGLVAALNKGVKLARANFIARQDADDISLPNRFREELHWLKASPRRGLVGGFFSYIDEKNKLTGITMTSTTKHIDIVRHMYFDNPIGHGTVLIRKQAIIEAGGYRDNYGPNEDYDLWRRIAPEWEIGQIPKVLYHYRLNPAGISSSNSRVQRKLFTELVKDIWQGPLYKKSVWAIVRDARYYKHMDSAFADEVHKQYRSHQVRLSFEFLIHGKLWTGYKNSLGALVIYPLGAIRLWNTWLWAPIKLLMGRSE
jgi:glycosyltransferase involved in cell wall biosynthesis